MNNGVLITDEIDRGMRVKDLIKHLQECNQEAYICNEDTSGIISLIQERDCLGIDDIVILYKE